MHIDFPVTERVYMNEINEFEIDVLELIRVLWKNVLVIMLVAVLLGSAVFGYTAFLVEPEYQATASMYVNNSSFNLGATSFSVSTGDLSASSSLVSVYLYILESRTTLEEVIQIAELTYTPDELRKMISTSTVEKTGAFKVTVTSHDPAEVELIANCIARILPDRIAEIVDGTSVRIVDYAIIPSRRSGPSIVKNTILGVLIGGVLSAAWIVVKHLLTDTSRMMIQSVDDLRDMYPDIMVLATVPDVRQSEKKSGYYSSYYGGNENGKKGGKRDGRSQRA